MIKVFFGILTSILLLLVNLSPALAALSSEPINMPRHPHRDKYQTDLFSGSASYSYPIKVPKGTNDLTPNVSLSYNSSSARDFVHHAGMGWELNRDYIERDVNFTPGDTNDDKFKIRFQGTYHDLVYVSSESRYHTKNETNLHITKQTVGETNDYNEYWQVIAKDGTKYRFGKDVNSELACNGRSYVWRWNLDQVEDIHGNKIFYTYSENDGASYLTKIEYNTEKEREINFTYTTPSNPYERHVYVQGCSVKEMSQLTDIQVKANSNLVHKFDLSYDTATNSGRLLKSITEKGNNGTSTLPSTSFNYYAQTSAWNSTHVVGAYPVDAAIQSNETTLADMNGDGLIDIVRSVNHGGPNNEWRVFKNNGNGWNTQYTTWVNPIDASLPSGEVRVADVNNDGYEDVVRSVNHGGPNNEWRVFINNGTSLSSQYVTWVNPVDAAINSSEVRLVDVTGDKLPDIVRSVNSGGPNNEWRVFKNTGTGWSSQYEIWANPIDAALQSSETGLGDVNGDGLTDIVRSVSNGGPNHEWRVFLNKGNSWNSQYDVWASSIDANLNSGEAALTDVNGDGLADVIRAVNNGGPNNEWRVFLNKGNSWNTQNQIWATAIDANILSEVTLSDVTGDGLIDIIRSANLGGPNNEWRIFKNNGSGTDLLLKINTSQGGSIDFEYKASTIYDNTGADSTSDLPFALWVVDKMTVSNGMIGAHMTSDVTTYSYQDGAYNSGEKEFRGFGSVEETLPNTAKKKYVFNQDDVLKGKLAEVQSRDSQNDPYAETEYTWSNTQSNSIYTVNLLEQKNYTYDGSASNPKIIETDYEYDAYGNITKQSEKGDTSTTTDDRFIYNDYVYNTTAWIVDTVKKTYKKASDDSTKVSESSFYYDSHTSLTDTPDKGNLTKEVKWLDTVGGTDPITQYAYDSYGNQTSVTDANNHTTTTAFDTLTHTYPISTTNAKNQVTTVSHDLGTGNLLSTTDPNGFTSSYDYDVFGRMTKEIKPYDSSTYPTTNYTYSFDGIAPENILVSKREVSSASGTLDTYTFTDGLDRKVQTRADAEDTSKQIVTDTFYDPNGEVKKETVPYLATAGTTYGTPDNNAKYTEKTFDALARVTILKNTKGDNKTIAYDHWKETTIDENGNIKRDYKNAFGKIIKVDEVKDGLSYSTTYSYTPQDDLSGISDASSNLTSFVYDSLRRKTSQTDPNMGTWEYEYDGVGNVTEQTDNRDVTIVKTYDELNRLTLVNYPTDTDITYTYDGNSKKGTLTTVVDKVGTVNYLYDNRLRKIQEERTINGTTKTTQFSYDAADRTKTQTNPDSEVITYAFNDQGEINSATGGTALVSDIDYNALGKITEKEFANGLTTDYTYNTNDFRLNRIQTGTLQDLNYTYDDVGNIKTTTDNVASKTKYFGYDDLDRLTTASESAGFNYAYEYNSIGNLTKFTNAGNETQYKYGEGSTRPHAIVGEERGEYTPQMATGYSAEYFNNNSLSGSPTLTRTDTDINFEWNNGSPDASITNDNFSARWTKTINFEEGYYVFSTTTDDGVRLYIDNVLIIDKWIGQGATTYSSAQNLSAGNHTIKMEYYEGGGGAVAKFNYLKLSQDFTGEYFSNKTLSGIPIVVRNDKAINFDWDTASPAANIPFDNFSARWNKVTNFSAGMYQFTIRGDDGIRLYVDEQLLIDGWVDQPATLYTTTKAMTTGDHRIRVEYYDSGWGANAQFTYQKVGEPFTGEYFNNQTLSGVPVATMSAAAIDFDWGDNAPHASISANQVSVRWTKTQNFAAGNYEFTITGDDGIRLFIDDVQVINGWYDQGSVSYTTTQSLTAGNHDIRVEYYEAWGGAMAKFSVNKVDTNLALNQTTNASTVENSDPDFASSKAVDGNTNTRWSSNASDPQWLAVDLGSRKTINRVKINWHSNYGSEYKIQMSENGIDWTTVKDIYWTNGNIDDVTGFYGTGRYIRLYGVQRATANGYSVNEFEAYGVTAPTMPTPAANPVITYDANGNMTSYGISCYQYNEANQVDKVSRCANSETIAEYVYDYNGNRMVKKNFTGGTHSSSLISWSDSFETKEIVGGSTESTSYYWINGELVAKKKPDGSKLYYQSDHLGSTSVITNQSGTLVEETKYDPWGEVLAGGTQSKFLYTGQEKDTETDLHYYNARYYNSDIRRFTQPDDIIQDVYDPQTLNRYSYVRNNPVRYTDPTGHYLESGLDLAFIGFDLITIIIDPTNQTNYEALAADLIGLAAPGGTGFGVVVRVAKNADKVKDVGKTTSNVVKESKITQKQDAKGQATSNQMAKIERQLATNGRASLEKSKRNLGKRLQEHEVKLIKIKENIAKGKGGHSSHVEKEIRNFRNELDAIDKVLKRKR